MHPAPRQQKLSFMLSKTLYRYDGNFRNASGELSGEDAHGSSCGIKDAVKSSLNGHRRQQEA
jgi:hypothetical protein